MRKDILIVISCTIFLIFSSFMAMVLTKGYIAQADSQPMQARVLRIETFGTGHGNITVEAKHHRYAATTDAESRNAVVNLIMPGDYVWITTEGSCILTITYGASMSHGDTC